MKVHIGPPPCCAANRSPKACNSRVTAPPTGAGTYTFGISRWHCQIYFTEHRRGTKDQPTNSHPGYHNLPRFTPGRFLANLLEMLARPHRAVWTYVTSNIRTNHMQFLLLWGSLRPCAVLAVTGTEMTINLNCR
jgi:hypothetical protein